MKKTLTIILLLLTPFLMSAQQVISDAALQTKRVHSSSSVLWSPLSPAGSTLHSTANAASTPMSATSYQATSTSFSSSLSQSSAHQSTSLSSTIYEPFAKDVDIVNTNTTRRRSWGLPDPGEQDNVSPVGNELVLLLLLAIYAAFSLLKIGLSHIKS